jgi:putative endonuclease
LAGSISTNFVAGISQLIHFCYISEMCPARQIRGNAAQGVHPPHLFSYASQVAYDIYMFYVYILKSKLDGKLYIGSTNDLRRRFEEHNKGQVRSTKSRAPFELRYYEAYFLEEDARHRERSLKKDGNALAQLKRRIIKSIS